MSEEKATALVPPERVFDLTTRAHTAADEFAAEFGHAHPWVAKIRALGGGE